MTEEERRAMLQSNYAMQLYGLGYGPDVTALPQKETSGWISVKDRLPERNGIYLAYDGEYISTVEYEKGRPDSEWTDDYEGYLDLLVTHWMPLPETPKEAE